MRAIQSHANNTWQLEVAFNAGNFVAETDEVRLSSFLKRQDGVALEAEIGLRHTGLCVGFRFGQRRFTRTRRADDTSVTRAKGVANFSAPGLTLKS